LHRLEEEDRNKVYEVLKELYSPEGKSTSCFEVSYEKDGTEYFIYRMVTKYDNTTSIVDYSYDKDYEGDEDSKSHAVIQKWTLDIPKEIMDKAIELCGEESVLNSYAIVRLFRDNKIEGAEKLVKWFIRHLEISELLNKHDEIKGIAKPKKEKPQEDEVAIAEAETSEYHGGSYDV
jgi:hypothetical protein